MVQIKVVYFSLLRDLTKKHEEYLDVDINTVQAALQKLFEIYGNKMRDLLLKEDNSPNDSVIITVNGKSIHLMNGIDTSLKDGDILTFFFAVGGGTCETNHVNDFTKKFK